MGEKTLKNLKEAFAGESQASQKYLAFSKVAEKEGLSSIAKLFRAASKAESIHAYNHLKNMGEISSTSENLKNAILGETTEFEIMYPKMISEAESENQGAAKIGFYQANKVEQEHATLYNEALGNLNNYQLDEIWVCSICGHTHIGPAPERCPVCGAPKEKFINIE